MVQNTTIILTNNSIRLVDFYYPGGRTYRGTYALNEVLAATGNRLAFSLEERRYDFKRHTFTRTSLAKAPLSLTKEQVRQLHTVFLQRIEAHCQQTGALWDSPMQWVRMPESLDVSDFLYEYSARFQHRYTWSTTHKTWVLPERNKAICWSMDWKDER